jgi:glutamine amidotransferase/cyclase
LLRRLKGGTLLRVFDKTDVEAALAAGIFQREEVPIETVKKHMRGKGIEAR